MALEFRNGGSAQPEALFTLASRTMVSLDGKRVIQAGKENGILLGIEGTRIPLAQAERLGLLAPRDAQEAAPEPAKALQAPEPAQVEDKAISAPSRGRKRK